MAALVEIELPDTSLTDFSPATDRTEQRPAKLKMVRVVFMDIVGYSKLLMDYREAALRTLQEAV